MSEIFEGHYLSNFDGFIKQLKVIFSDETVQNNLNTILSLDNAIKLQNGQTFVDTIDDDNFELFVKSKIKVFSHKNEQTKTISESLFGADFCLKNLLNNQTDEVKAIIWYNLHSLFMITELRKPVELRNNAKLSALSKVTAKQKQDTPPATTSIPKYNAKKKLQEMLGVDINKETTGMIDEIVSSFENILSKQSGGNPLSGIMEISQLVSTKYADKINNGEIELDKLMKAISKKVPGMEKMMEGILSKTPTEKPKEKVVIDENFSTASVPVGEVKEDDKGFNISGILKMADQFGVIPGGKPKEESNESGDIPNIGKVMELMKKLESTKTKEEADALKQEMDSFLQKELGVDVEKLNEQLNTVTKEMNNV